MGAVSVDQRAPIGPLPVGAKLGRYEILGKLAAGGMAIVYVARAHGVAGFERLVAIKVLHGNLAHEEEFIKMFLDEARLAASIRHPNVVPTMDISDSEKAGYFIVMEYIEGDHLGQLLSSANKAGEKLPISVTLRVICDALGGLGAAHDLVDEQGRPQNLVHRDVSPHNIMVGRDGVARLTDFGVAKAEDRLTHTRDGQVKGKLAYMAPEQAASGMTDVRSDLFSMGVILWECLTGQRLMRAESTGATLHKLLHGEIPKPSSVDPALAPLDPVLDVALARDPAQRFQNAEAFARALEDIAHHFGGGASLREVGRVVKHHAAAKLKRDKKLIDEALKALRPPTGEASAPMFTDETSSPTSPSNTDISIVANAPSLISKVAGNTVANETMPGTRRATRRTLDVPIPEALAENPVQSPMAVSGVAPAAPDSPAAMAVSGEVPLASSSELSPSVMPTAIAAIPAGALRAGASPADVSEIAAQSEATADRSMQRLRVAVLLLGVAALVLFVLWAGGSSPEVVQVEEMTPAEHVAAGHLGAAPKAGPAVRTAEGPAGVVPVATIPASTSDDVVTAPVSIKAPAAQPIVPVVRSGASGATPAAVSGNRTREVAPKAAKPAVRRHRDPKASARPTDVIPNPYHD